MRPSTRRWWLFVVAGAIAIGVAATPRTAAAELWVHRPITLRSGQAALDLGLGLARRDAAPEPYQRGVGLNLELALGISYNVELGFRAGFRLNGDGPVLRPDHYGRAYETETYWGGGDDVANPEVKLRFGLAYGPTAQLALDLRAYLPFDSGPLGLMFALPLRLHAGALRVDTGVYVPMLLADPYTVWVISLPVHIWIQASNVVWLGPILGFRAFREGDARWSEVPFGFGLGVALAHNADFRAWFLFPDIRNDDREFGGGVALQIRF